MRSTHRKKLRQIVDVVFDGNQKEAADAAQINETTFHRILVGKTKSPTIGTIQRLADGFGVTVGWLTGADAISELPGYFSGNYPDWFWLLLAYRRRRCDSLLKWLAQLTPSNHRLKKIRDSLFAEEGEQPRQTPLSMLMWETYERAGKIPASFIPAMRAETQASILQIETVVNQLKKWDS